MKRKSTSSRILELVKNDPVALCAFYEDEIRREISRNICFKYWGDRNYVPTWTNCNEFARHTGISQVQSRRILHYEVGAKLHLDTIIKVANALRLVQFGAAKKDSLVKEILSLLSCEREIE